MSQDPPTLPLAGSNLPEFTVSELSLSLKRLVESEFGRVRVRGEISQPKYHSSGHLYLTLKDDQAVLAAVCWRGSVARLTVRAEEGLEVICTGRLTTYPGQSKYQLVIESMEAAGLGALLAMLEERKRRLAAEGLFDQERKRPLPRLPRLIGIVTSPSGAVIRDILHRLADRFPRPVLLWPVAVQGDAAADQVAGAIAGFNGLPDGSAQRPDLLIVARGGGSLEDLMPFNEEVVVRAAAEGTIPLISAIGHETDTTLLDFVADRRAPTPTAAAEMAVPVRADLMAQLLDGQRRLVAGTARLFGERRLRLEGLARGLGDPARLLEPAFQRFDDRTERLDRATRVALERHRAALGQLSARLVHPRERLAAAARHAAAVAERFAALGPTLTDWRRHRFAPLAGDRLDRAVRALLARAGDRLAASGSLLDSYSYKDVLRRGFVLVRDSADEPVTDAEALAPGAAISLEFRDDRRVPATVDGPAPPRPRAAPQRAKPAPGQGTLF
ncbi:MAG: exodeoxyribonuclease VII large subunit [Rhodospirillaceae bacterium]|nr:exodeoxyribonuclease VII large subunit [Rhodospirillaceae bacterium]